MMNSKLLYVCILLILFTCFIASLFILINFASIYDCTIFYTIQVRSRLLPDGLTGNIRIVDIGIGESKVDVNTCCGTHGT